MSLTYRFLGLSLLVAAGLSACKDGNGGNLRKSGGAGFVHSTQQVLDAECSCIGEIEGAEAEAECIVDYSAELGDDPKETEACIDRTLADHPDDVEPFGCLVNAQYRIAECAAAQSCDPPFSCEDGGTIDGSWVCDGEADCAGGEDERQNCPAPQICDGEPLPSYLICNGEADCSDGSDEPADCEADCEYAAYTAFESCGDVSEAFANDFLENCLEIELEDDIDGEPGEPIPCDDAECVSVEDPASWITLPAPEGPDSAQRVRRAIQGKLTTR